MILIFLKFYRVAAHECKYRHLVRMGTMVVDKGYLPQPGGKSMLVDFKSALGSLVCLWEVMSQLEYFQQQCDAKKQA